MLEKKFADQFLKKPPTATASPSALRNHRNVLVFLHDSSLAAEKKEDRRHLERTEKAQHRL